MTDLPLPDKCPDCGGYVDHWAEATIGEPLRVGWDCQHCDSANETTMIQFTDFEDPDAHD